MINASYLWNALTNHIPVSLKGTQCEVCAMLIKEGDSYYFMSDSIETRKIIANLPSIVEQRSEANC